jgi:hypothetical protein
LAGAQVYSGTMSDHETALDLRRTQLLAVQASLADARRALVRAACIHSPFSQELRALVQVIAEVDSRVTLESGG